MKFFGHSFIKCLNILTLSFYFIALISARPVDKAEDRQVDTPTPSPPRSPPPTLPPNPNTPRPEDSPRVPLPGRSGVYTDSKTQISTAYYGEGDLDQHMGHLTRNQLMFPHNRDPMPLASSSSTNRRNALRGVPSAPVDPLTGADRVRDEKSPAMLANPHHATSTTVEYLDKKESSREGSILSQLRKAMDQTGKNALGQLRPNPGFLPIHPDQRRGHEAPARMLNAPFTTVPSSEVEKKADTKASKPKTTTKQDTDTGTKEYTPMAGDKVLRTRKGVNEPAPKEKLPTKETKPKGESNLRSGSILPAGQRWIPTDWFWASSHADAPPYVEHRAPPFYKNREEYMKNHEKMKQGEVSQHLSQPVPVWKATSDPAIAAFNQKFPPKRGNGNGRAHEAPASLPSAPTHHSDGHDSHTNTRAGSGDHGHQPVGQRHSNSNSDSHMLAGQAGSAATDFNHVHRPSGQPQPQPPRRSPRFASSQSGSSNPIGGGSSSKPLPAQQARPSNSQKSKPAGPEKRT